MPHNVPLCFWYDEAAHFYFIIDLKPKRMTGTGLKRMRNLAENPQVALIIDHYEEDWSCLAYVLVHGAGHIVEDPNEYMLALRNLRDKYPQYRTMALGFDKNPMVRIDALRVHVWGERFKPLSSALLIARPAPIRLWGISTSLRSVRLSLGIRTAVADSLSAGSAEYITAIQGVADVETRGNATALRDAAIDGWLFYDFRMSDPLAYRILGIPEKGITSRRWFFFIPAMANPARSFPRSRLTAWTHSLPRAASFIDPSARWSPRLPELLKGRRRIAMNYSPECAIPYVSRVDAGTVELVRSMGVEVVTAADLIQRFEAVLTPRSSRAIGAPRWRLREIVNETFAEISRRVRGHLPCTEFTMQNFVLGRIAAHNLHTDEAPIVATNANAANPHFSPFEEKDTPIRRGDLVLLDLFAKERDEDSIYGDLTWMGFVGDRVDDEHARIFHLVADARDAAVALIQSRVNEGRPVSGEEADRAARTVIEDAGFGDQFVHRTGHSIGREVHGTGCNLDSLETRDYRMLIDRTCFSVEPGIYLPGKVRRAQRTRYDDRGRPRRNQRRRPRNTKSSRSLRVTPEAPAQSRRRDNHLPWNTNWLLHPPLPRAPLSCIPSFLERGRLPDRMGIRAIAFDLDGTLSDTEPLHFEAFKEVIRPAGIEIPREDYYSRLIGLNDHDCFATAAARARRGCERGACRQIDRAQGGRLRRDDRRARRALSRRGGIRPSMCRTVSADSRHRHLARGSGNDFAPRPSSLAVRGYHCR